MNDEGTDAQVAGWLLYRFVCCGQVKDVLSCLHDALRAFCIEDWVQQRAALEIFRAKHFRSNGAYGSYLHYLRSMGFEEHQREAPKWASGHKGCSPGWATDQARRVLKFLDKQGTDMHQWSTGTPVAEYLH